MKSLQTYDSNTKTTITTKSRQFMDIETGEVFDASQVTKICYGQKNFWKMYMFDFLAILGIFESRQLDVFCYICENTNSADNIFMGTVREIAENIGCSTKTVSTCMKRLQDSNFLTKKYGGVYRINPDILSKGTVNKQNMLISYYNSEKAQNDKPIEMVTDNQLTILDVDCNIGEVYTPNLPQNAPKKSKRGKSTTRTPKTP